MIRVYEPTIHSDFTHQVWGLMQVRNWNHQKDLKPHLNLTVSQILLLPNLFSVQALDGGRNQDRKGRKADVRLEWLLPIQSGWQRCSQRPSQALLFSSLGHLGLPTPPWWVLGRHPSRNIMVRPRSEDIPATDLQPNGSLISVSSSLQRPVTAIKDSSPPLLSHPRPLPATATVRWPWLSFPLSLSNCKPVTLRGVSVSSEQPQAFSSLWKAFYFKNQSEVSWP